MTSNFRDLPDIQQYYMEERVPLPDEAQCGQKTDPFGGYCHAFDVKNEEVRNILLGRQTWPQFENTNLFDAAWQHHENCPAGKGLRLVPTLPDGTKVDIQAGIAEVHANFPARRDSMGARRFSNFINVKGTGLAKNACLLWANGSGPPVVFLQGFTGTGKTHLLEASLREARARGKKVRFEYTSDYIHSLYPASDDPHDVYVFDADYIGLDDICSEKHTEFTEQELSRVIDYCYRDGVRLMLTTNILKQENVADALGDRLASRLFDSNSGAVSRIVLTNGDYRSRG